MPARFWEIAAGCMTFIFLSKETAICIVIQKIPALLIFLAIVGVLFLSVNQAVFATISIVLLTGILIYCLNHESLIYRLLTHEKVLYIAAISYSLYLWHWSILSLARWTIGINAFTTLPLLGLILLASTLSFKYIETPCRNIKISSRLAIFAIVSGFISTAIYLTQRSDSHWYRFFYLGQKYNEMMPIKYEKQTFFIVGDSYARDFYTLLPPNDKVEKFILDGCTFFDLSSEVYKKCTLHSGNWDQILNKWKSGDIVFAISARPSATISDDTTQLNDFLIEILPELADKNITLAIRAPFPRFDMHKQNGYLCQKEWFRPLDSINPLSAKISHVKRSEANKSIEEFRFELRPISSKYPNLVILDYSKIFCGPSRCLPYNSSTGSSFTYDGGHLYRWSKELSERLSTFLDKEFR